jgi:quercetin dioxygenase-like cupin family protein
MMTNTEFLNFLTENQFPEPVRAAQPANQGLEEHAHDFAVWALVLEGSISLHFDGQAHSFKAGEVFHVPYQKIHSEQYGPEGVKYLVSRKY